MRTLTGTIILPMTLACAALAFSWSGAAGTARADGCYLCEGGGYVAYIGQDTWEMRKKAESAGCKVSGTTSTCSRPKATVTLAQPGGRRP